MNARKRVISCQVNKIGCRCEFSEKKEEGRSEIVEGHCDNMNLKVLF